jgi:uncharacterized membrane protein YecN with MAPEG domain
MEGSVTGLYAGLVALLVVALGGRVVRLRQQHRVGIGDGGQPALARAIRAHGNLIENAPLLLLLLLVAELSHALPAAGLHAAGTVIVLGRALHAFGLSRSAGTSIGRLVGMILTWSVLAALALAVIFHGLAVGR